MKTKPLISVDGLGQCLIEGKAYPALGFGTYKLQDATCTEALIKAISIGYRIIDTATYYHNFEAIGKALKTVNREEIYLISKVWHDQQRAQNLESDFHRALEKMDTTYLDAYFIHWPNSQIPIEETLGAMDALKKQKKVRHLGLSNVTVHHVQRALDVGIPIDWVQIEMNPYFFDEKLYAFCTEHQIAFQAWAPLGQGRAADNSLLIEIGKCYGMTPSQVALSYLLGKKVVPLVKSSNKERMQENWDARRFSLPLSEIQKIDSQAKLGKRYIINPEKCGFSDEFSFTYDECWPKKVTNKSL